MEDAIAGESVRMILPMPMKTLGALNVRDGLFGEDQRYTYPNIEPEPIMYFPSVLMTPAWPAPYWKIVTVPARPPSV